VREDFGDHFGIFDKDREVLLAEGFPVYANSLIGKQYPKLRIIKVVL
jgi:hypothetical protein